MSLPFPLALQGDKPKPLDDSVVPPLSRWERGGAVLTALGGVGVGGLGFYASFDAVSAKAAEWGFEEPWVLPTAIDSAIPVFTGAYLLLIRMGMPLAWARLVPWALSLITCALNVAAGDSLWSKVAHGAMSLLWVVVSEIAAHTYAVRIGAVTGRRRMDKIRQARWFLSPVPTFLLWRRMKLWELVSYDQVLELEQERLVYRAELRSKFGRAWRRKAPVASLLPLQLVRAGVPLKETAPTGLIAAGIKPTGIFALPPAAPLEEKKVRPVPAVPSAANKPRPVTATVTPQPQPQPQGQGQGRIPQWSTEDELYVIIKDILDNGHREVFEPGGPLTGAEIAGVLGQSEGNGRKVRQRLIKTYAAERGIDLPPKATIDQVFAAFAHPLTPVSP
ncbi:DUF2637 domain-containing protein [Streptomyces sp. SP18BB07]|uniref:DUF2637 domain-containing protein n=1 Tax=Streptomyces sp. SP18BB07 TaxID=3002522 RepID=UPI002E76FA54|nr:DUF2637 domain-containing protein [Streptomyces sp. SP18BB07]MEE1764433.1 DUF2637 domain-containing protein [Streptomyces sp. SP18BB07]